MHMSQTTAIVGGGIAIIAAAVLLYFLSGDGIPKSAENPFGKVTVEEKTLTIPGESAGAPLTETATEAIKDNMTTRQTAAGTATTQSEVVLKTTKGDITLRLYFADAPKTVENFVKLATANFYNGVRFHRVIKDFMIQGGDPNSKDDSRPQTWGQGGPGYQFADEINPTSALYQKGYKRGVLAMANAGPNTNGSQFFIMHKDYPLPPLYTIFGEVISGIDVVDAIAETPVLPGDRPKEPITIISATVK